MSEMASAEGHIVLTGTIPRRIKKYATEEERNQAKLASVKKYASKKYYCQICDKIMSISNYRKHLWSDIHTENTIAKASGDSLNHIVTETES